MKRPVFTVH